MKKALNLNITKRRHLDKLTACCGKLPLLGERVGVRGQQALTKAFTLAEVLITLAIIGVVAAMAIPSVISNAQQQEFKTGLRKAVSVLNSAITMNIALDGETPYDNGDLFRYLQKHMSIMKSTTFTPWAYKIARSNGDNLHTSTAVANRNAAFYTTDGMRFEFYSHESCNPEPVPDVGARKLHESAEGYGAHFCVTSQSGNIDPTWKCGSYGLASNPNNTTATPCIIMVDVNGDRKPYPVNVSATNTSMNTYKMPAPTGKKVSDIFGVMITEDRAIPFGVVAQRAMYQAQK